RGQDVREEDGRLVAHLVRERAQRAIGLRHANQLRLPAVESRIDAGVAEERAALALRDAAGAAGGTRAVRDHARVDDALSGPYALHGRADLDDLAGELVAEHGPRLEAGREPVEGEEVGAADRGRTNSDDCVAQPEDRRVGYLFDRDDARRTEDDRRHAGCSISTRWPSGSTQNNRQPPHGGSYGSARNRTRATAT